ncbi:hypothetical protein SanaruYs_34230 [Chryseotalea sanaruensis]|uniref:Nitrogen fixation protein NifH n=1 Tax=Chryseotalea sanaruensis TaxID=2482724 RepID=A0A401UE83_9BACT|nr:hypothetical protein [Chryseotalea sanaruensis]GCC53180.1 hypothetical protein SanaruYs_34230 [Chryseotalea sanaruensis]
MDSALELKIGIDNGYHFSNKEILDKLQNSELVGKLIADMPVTPLAIVWRLICISEIPFSNKLDYTQKLIEIVYSKLATPYGFSLSRDEKMFLPCYNAMVVSALCRLGRANDRQVKNAVDWINSNQPMERGIKVDLPNFNFDRYGGCFKKTPCYIGLAKSVFALQDFKEQTKKKEHETQLQKGISYLLEHKFFKRLSKDEPINKHITDISFPETYHLNSLELLRFAKKANLLANKKTTDLISHIEKRKTKDGKWKNNFNYKAEGYVAFDSGKKTSDWTTHLINEILKNKKNSH